MYYGQFVLEPIKKVPTYHPSQNIKIHTAGSDNEQCNLIVQEGDICIRVDLGKSYFFTDNMSWQEYIEEPVESISTSVGNIVLTEDDINQKDEIPVSVVPDLNLTNTYTVSSEVDKTELEFKIGDICICTNENKSYIAIDNENWYELTTPKLDYSTTITTYDYFHDAYTHDITDTWEYENEK